jgi:hypothetical protein
MHITVDLTLIHLITGLSMQGPDPQHFYLGKTLYFSLAQHIKEAYDEVEKGKQGYKVSSIQDGAMHLACQIIAGKLIRKNHPTQDTEFVVYLAGKCVEGMQMNWASYLVNKLEKDFHEAQDQGHKFHFIWLFVLIAFVAWKMLEGASFPEIEPSKPLIDRFYNLWYMNDISKKWKSNAVFHAYYQQLKVSIELFPQMTPHTQHQYRPLAKFRVDPHFIYITMCIDESKEELQSYHKLIDEDMEQSMKEFPIEFLVPVDDEKLSEPEIIGSPLVTWFEHARHTNVKKKKKKEEFQNIETDEEENASEESRPRLPAVGGGDEVNQELGGEEGEIQEEGEATPPKDPPTETKTSKKRKVSLQKPSARKKTRTSKPQLEAMLMEDDIGLVCGEMEDAYEDLLQRYGMNQEELYVRVEKELKEIQRAIQLSRAVPTAPSLSEIAELGDELAQI